MKIIKLVGALHRKQFDLVNLSSCYDGVRFVLPNYEGSFDFELPTELNVTGDFEASNYIKKLDDKLVFKNFCDDTGLKTLPWSTGSVKIPGRYVFKPRISSGSIGIKIKDCETNEPIPLDYIAEWKLNEFQTFGIGYYAYEGVIRNQVTWKRIKTFPRGGGPSTIAKVVEYPELERMGAAFLEKLNPSDVHGFFMLEFITSGDDLFFLEMNPRIWGSIALLEVSDGGFISNFVSDNLGHNVYTTRRLSRKAITFVNPLFEPLALLNWRGTFYSGFSYGGLNWLVYMSSILNFQSIKKIVLKVFR